MSKLGYGSITLTDLTETLPISLILENTSSYTVQTKIGNLYSPNFEEGEGVKITPSLFRGNQEINIGENLDILTALRYEIDTGEKEYIVSHENPLEEEINGKISTIAKIDEKGILYYQKNLFTNLKINAYISKYTDIQHNIIYENIFSGNPINILFLEHGNNAYSAIIKSKDGREHFEEANRTDITLIANLYHGEELLTNVSYKWDKISDVDDGGEQDFFSSEQEITISRSSVGSTEIYSCSITDNETGIEYIASKVIRDFTDIYNSILIPDSSLVLTPEKKTVNLTCQLWQGANLIDDDNIEYSWFLLKSDSEIDQKIEGQTTKNLTIDVSTENNIFPQENFTILCKAIRYGSTSLAYVNITYSPIQYSIEISPRTIFLAATNEGANGGTGNIQKEFTFKLLDNNKQPLIYNSETSNFIASDNISIKNQQKNSQGKDLWSYTLLFTLKEDSNFWSTDIDSQIFEFDYTYLNNKFTEQIIVQKNYAGIIGQEGTGYTILLTNESINLPGTATSALPNITKEIKIITYKNTEQITSKITKIEDVNINENTGSIANFDFLIEENNSKQVILKLTTKDSVPIEGGSIFLNIEADGKTYLKTISYTVSLAGATGSSGNTYQLINLPTALIYKVENGAGIFIDADSREPATITADAVYYIGADMVPNIYTGKFKLYGSVTGIDQELIIESTNSSFSYQGLSTSANLRYRHFKLKLFDIEGNRELDEQSIPVLREGYLYGGQNLLLNSEITIEEDEILLQGALNLVSRVNWQEFFGQDLTLSFTRFFPEGEKKNISEASNSNLFGFWLEALYDWGEGGTTTEKYFFNQLSIVEETTFIKNLSRLSSTINLLKPTNNNYKLQKVNFTLKYSLSFYINAVLENTDGVELAYISLPKLEFGTESTSWSPAQEDISFSSIQGINLISTSYKKNLSYGEELLVEIDETDSYTLSWQKLEGEVNITIIGSDLSSFSKKDTSFFSYTFSNLERGQLFQIQGLSIDRDVSITQIKFERGKTATDWLITNEDLQIIIDEINTAAQDYTDNQLDQDNLIKILNADGKVVTISSEEWDNVQTVTSTVIDEGVNVLTSYMQAYSSLIITNPNTGEENFYLTEIVSRIHLGYDNNGTPYLQMSMSSAQEEEISKKYSMKLTNEKLSFYEDEKELAFFSSSQMYISTAVIGTNLIFGEYKTGGIIFYPGQSGVGVGRIKAGDPRFPIL